MKRNYCDLREQLKVSDADEIHDRFLQSWLKRIETPKYLKLDRLQPGAVEKLRSWKEQDIRLVLATMRNNTRNLHWQLKVLNILGLFDQVVVTGSGHGGFSKARAVLQQIGGYVPSGTVWIGDTEADVIAARQIGIKIIALTCGLRTEAHLRSFKPDYLVPDLQGVNLEEIDPC